MPNSPSTDDARNQSNPSQNASASEFSRQPLKKDLQKIVDEQDKWYDQIYEGTAKESTTSNLRYAAYASRIRTILTSAHRYVAYTSDVGESFRPVAHPWLVRSAYGISWAYVLGDVGYEGYKAHLRNQRSLHPFVGVEPVPTSLPAEQRKALVLDGSSSTKPPQHVTSIPLIDDSRIVMLQRAIFQSIASMGLPAFTIHSIVRYTGRAMKDIKNVKVRTWGPIGLGLSAVPFLPYLFDKPVEEAVEWAMYAGCKAWGGPDAVRGRATTGREEELARQARRRLAHKDD